MSESASISIRANGHLQHMIFPESSTLRDVLLECISIVDKIRDASNRGDLLIRLGEDPDEGYNDITLEILQMESPSDFDAIIDLTDRVIAYEGLDGKFEDVKWWKPLIETPEQYDAAAKVGGWPKEALMSFGILDHVKSALEGVSDANEAEELAELFSNHGRQPLMVPVWGYTADDATDGESVGAEPEGNTTPPDLEPSEAIRDYELETAVHTYILGMGRKDRLASPRGARLDALIRERFEEGIPKSKLDEFYALDNMQDIMQWINENRPDFMSIVRDASDEVFPLVPLDLGDSDLPAPETPTRKPKHMAPPKADDVE